MTPRRLLVPILAAGLLAACGGSSTPPAAGGAATGAASPGSAAPTPSAASGSTSAGGTASSPSASAPAPATGATPGSSSPVQTSTAKKAAPGTAAAGTYTYDTTGTVTVGTPKDAAGTATLTVDPPSAGTQHSVLADDQGRTEQDVAAKPTGAYLARLVISNPAFNKEFRPASPVLLVPEPATPGRSWAWTATSTDGKTTVAVSARISRRETLTIGGVATPTSLVTSTLKLTGDVTYTAQMQTWYDAVHRLSVKDHTRGNGTFGGVAFSTDVTGVLRSTRPA
jgi:hypothetical protein